MHFYSCLFHLFQYFVLSTSPFAPPLQYARIIHKFRRNAGKMYKKKKVAALKHRQRQKKLKEKMKAQAEQKEQ